MPLRHLSRILWRERHLAELVGRGGAERLELHLVELDRALVVEDLIAALRLDPDVTLLELAANVPPPWPEVLATAHSALTEVDPEVIPRSLADFLR